MKIYICTVLIIIITFIPVYSDSTYKEDIIKIIRCDTKNYSKNSKAQFGVYVKDLNSNIETGENEEEIFITASTVKLFMASVVYHLDNIGEIELESTIKDPVTKKEYNLEYITKRMVTNSVNDYFNILLRYIGKERTNEIVKELGGKDTYISNEIMPSSVGTSRASNIKRYGCSVTPTTTPKDLGHFLFLAYTNYYGEKNSKLLMDSLLGCVYHNRIPMSINYKSKVAHKTGTTSTSYNDAGIVFLDGNPYIIVLMSKNVSSDAQSILRNISKHIYDYQKSATACAKKSIENEVSDTSNEKRHKHLREYLMDRYDRVIGL